MPALRVTKLSRRSRREAPAVHGLVVSGLTELVLGALTGWPMAIAVSRPQDLEKLGIRSGARLRQWHLDLIMLGGLTAAAPSFVPDVPRTVAVPLAVGAWVNANALRRAGLPAGTQRPPGLQSRRRRLVHLGLLGLRGNGRRRLEALAEEPMNAQATPLRDG